MLLVVVVGFFEWFSKRLHYFILHCYRFVQILYLLLSSRHKNLVVSGARCFYRVV